MRSSLPSIGWSSSTVLERVLKSRMVIRAGSLAGLYRMILSAKGGGGLGELSAGVALLVGPPRYASVRFTSAMDFPFQWRAKFSTVVRLGLRMRSMYIAP